MVNGSSHDHDLLDVAPGYVTVCYVQVDEGRPQLMGGFTCEELMDFQEWPRPFVHEELGVFDESCGPTGFLMKSRRSF